MELCYLDVAHRRNANGARPLMFVRCDVLVTLTPLTFLSSGLVPLEVVCDAMTKIVDEMKPHKKRAFESDNGSGAGAGRPKKRRRG